MSTIFIEKLLAVPGNTTFRININSLPAFLMCDNLCTCIVLKDTQDDTIAVLTYAMNTFYDQFIGVHILLHLDKDNVQYYNTSEEQVFQYNTVQDYNTHQAMVHIHDAIQKRGSKQPYIVLEELQALIDNPMGLYTITIEEQDRIKYDTQQQ